MIDNTRLVGVWLAQKRGGQGGKEERKKEKEEGRKAGKGEAKEGREGSKEAGREKRRKEKEETPSTGAEMSCPHIPSKENSVTKFTPRCRNLFA